MVRLRAITESITEVRTTFQFHYGTIESLRCRFGIFRYVLFQFHYGTIESSVMFYGSISERYFNSTMVRLRV